MLVNLLAVCSAFSSHAAIAHPLTANLANLHAGITPSPDTARPARALVITRAEPAWYSRLQDTRAPNFEPAPKSARVSKPVENKKIQSQAETPDSVFNRATSLAVGYKVEQDRVAAFEMMKTLADSGHRKAQFELGYYLENGLGAPKNLELAILSYGNAARAGDKLALVTLEDIYLHRGSSAAALQLAKLHEEGILGFTNLAKAQSYYERAARSDDHAGSVAAYHLGLLKEGNSATPDFLASYPWYYKAANGKFAIPEAQFKAGFIIFHQFGSKSPSEVSKAKSAGLQVGKGASPSIDLTEYQHLDLAYDYFNTAARRGHLGAKLWKAYLLNSGQGVEANPKVALRILQELASTSIGPLATLKLDDIQRRNMLEKMYQTS